MLIMSSQNSTDSVLSAKVQLKTTEPLEIISADAPTSLASTAVGLTKKDYETMSRIVKHLTEHKNEEYAPLLQIHSEADLTASSITAERK